VSSSFAVAVLGADDLDLGGLAPEACVDPDDLFPELQRGRSFAVA